MKIMYLDATELMSINRNKIIGIPTDDKKTIVLILSEEYLLNEYLLYKIKGHNLDLVLIPKSIKTIFEQDTEIRPSIIAATTAGGRIDYF